MAVRVRRTDYAVALDDAGLLAAGDAPPVEFGVEWTPEHLVLAGLARCVVISLGYHARRDGLAHRAAANASGTVTRRADGSWGFVEIECHVDAHLDPLPDEEPLSELLFRAQRGCFIGSSLEPRPKYVWKVNGAAVAL